MASGSRSWRAGHQLCRVCAFPNGSEIHEKLIVFLAWEGLLSFRGNRLTPKSLQSHTSPVPKWDGFIEVIIMEYQCSICKAPADFKCFCAVPTNSFCIACIKEHKNSPGNHVFVPIQNQENAPVPVEGPNEMCDGCRGKVALTFCLCSVPLKKLCAGCNTTHYDNAREMAHYQHPMEAYELVKSGKMSY